MNKITRSYWTLKKDYFKAVLVNNFKEKYRQWYCEGSLYNSVYGLDEDEEKALSDFCDKITEKGVVELYQFPPVEGTRGDPESQDYFEKEDDNYVIPHHLFNVKED